jgi:hypothetical protein
MRTDPNFDSLACAMFFNVHLSGYYAWLNEPLPSRANANAVLVARIREFFDQIMGIYSSPRNFFDLRETGVACSEN